MFIIRKVNDSLALVDHYGKLFAVLPPEYELISNGPGMVALDKATGYPVPWQPLPNRTDEGLPSDCFGPWRGIKATNINARFYPVAMLIFVQLSKADADKELSVRKAFKQQYSTDPIISFGDVSQVKQVIGTAKTEDSGNAEREWVRGTKMTTVESAQRTLEFCLSKAA